MRKKLLTRTALAATIALGIGSFNLAYAAETEDTSSGKKINVMASFYPMYDFATKFGGDKQLCRKARVTEMWLVLFFGK